MTKNLFILCSMLLFFLGATAQKSENPFIGKTFRIDNYIGDKFDNSEDLIFTADHVEGSVCVEYGFPKAKYTFKKDKKGQWEFTCTMVSKEHGKMVWNGVSKGNKIEGDYLWTKAGQDPLAYTFKGKLK